MTKDELEKYLDGGVGYGWHISNLKIYDTPKELIEFHTWKKCKSCNNHKLTLYITKVTAIIMLAS